MKSIFCATPYHQQDGQTFCGPAVAEMLLAKLGSPTLQQLDIAAASMEPVGNTGMSADGLVKALMKKLSRGFDSSFVVYPDSDREEGIERIIDALFATRLPVPVLVFGGDSHWVLVTGAVVDDAPRPGKRTELHGFYIANPAPITASRIKNGAPSRFPAPPPPPHSDYGGRGDGCGDGELRGGRYAYVSAAAWRNHNWPIPEPGKRARPFVSVTSTHVPSSAELLAARIESAEPPLMATSPISNENASLVAAKLAVHVSGIDAFLPFNGAFAGAEPRQWTRYNIAGAVTATWYLVTFVRDGDSVGVAHVDAATGQLMGAMAPPTVVMTDLELTQFVVDQLALRSAEVADVIDGRPVTPDDADIEPVRFWKPCYESTSPFYGFTIVHIRGRKKFVLPHVGMYDTLSATRCTPRSLRQRRLRVTEK